ncbi:ankyrin [Hypoxylon cercidicola]|nr:ankyrin [Hypoxylon cercidicola]
MTLFSLPPELVGLIFRFILFSRDFRRIMRIRLVNRQFRFYIDDAIFSLSFLRGIVDRSSLSFAGLKQSSWSAYVFSYLTYQARREGPTASSLGRVYRAAKTLYGGSGDGEAFTTCLNSLIRLASSRNISDLLRKPIAKPKELCSSTLEADLAVAAIYLSRIPFIKQLIAEGIQFCGTAEKTDVYSEVFGYAFEAATRKGNLEVIKLLLSCTPEYRDAGTLSVSCQKQILEHAGSYGHRTAFDFALDLRPIILPKKQPDLGRSAERKFVENALRDTPWPDNYARAAAILGTRNAVITRAPKCHPFMFWLASSALNGKVEMVRYFLGKGASPNPVGTMLRLPLRSALRTRQEKIFRILIDAGAEPNLYPEPEELLMHTAWMGNIPLTQLLLDCGVDINQGFPCPIALAILAENTVMFDFLRQRGARLDTPETGGWAMALATMHGLDSMVDLLVREGVGKDYILHYAPSPKQYHVWLGRLRVESPQGT